MSDSSFPRIARLVIEFQGYWLSGTGWARGRHLDDVTYRDRDGLPAMPMTQIKGQLRETAERLALGCQAGWTDDVVKELFGTRVGDAADAGQSGRGCIAFRGEARMSDAARDFLRADRNRHVREPVIVWNGSQGRLKRPSGVEASDSKVTPFDASEDAIAFIVPGSSLKGPLAHRTLFHWNRTQKDVVDGDRMIDAASLDGLPPDRAASRIAQLRSLIAENLGQPPRQLADLFGAAKDPADSGAAAKGKVGRAARIIFDDATARGVVVVQALDHVSIDRFTGGARAGALYVEEVLIGGEIADVTILPPIDDDGTPRSWTDERYAGVVRAFCHALHDLCRGQLAIGAKSLGFCAGSPTWKGDPQAKALWERAYGEVKAAAGEDGRRETAA